MGIPEILAKVAIMFVILCSMAVGLSMVPGFLVMVIVLVRDRKSRDMMVMGF